MGNKLDLALKIAWKHYGRFYLWGGDDPSGFDCSGFVLEILQSVGVISSTHDLTADDMYREWYDLYKINNPFSGCLAFRVNTNNKAYHVGFMIDSQHVMHAGGGGSYIKTVSDAIKHNAFIKVRPIWRSALFINLFNSSHTENHRIPYEGC